METLIVICLLIVIILLVQDRIVIYKKGSSSKSCKENIYTKLPDIMGKPKPTARPLQPIKDNQGYVHEAKEVTHNFDDVIGNNQADTQIPQEEPDDVFGNGPDLEEEEEEWKGYRIPGTDNGFATGVTFEELSTVGMLLQKDRLEPSQNQAATAIVHKLQGTELFSLLENSIDDASRKIAELLDNSLTSMTNTDSSNLRKNDLKNFDIGEFT
ncbi:conjugal transfer protein TraD [Flavobacterium sp.]|uniref:conjugal transfer protein TraD n=1 Tax=Flavobacterium sp. TaxID=239 RepID=UPI003A93AEEA